MRALVLTALVAALAVAAPSPPSTVAHEFEGLKPILALQNGEDALKTYEMFETFFTIENAGSVSEMNQVKRKVMMIAKTMKNFEASGITHQMYFQDLARRFNSMTPEAKDFIRKAVTVSGMPDADGSLPATPSFDADNYPDCAIYEVFLRCDTHTLSVLPEVYKQSAWIYVGGLKYEMSEGGLITVFSQFGEILNVNLIRDKKTGKSKGFAFICYQDQRSTNLAVDNFNGYELLKRIIRVDHVEEYKVPKYAEDADEETKRLWEKGCGSEPIFEAAPSAEEFKKQKKRIKKEAKKTFALSVSHFLLTELLLPLIKKSEEGRIIDVSSMLHTHSGALDVSTIDDKASFGPRVEAGWNAYTPRAPTPPRFRKRAAGLSTVERDKHIRKSSGPGEEGRAGEGGSVTVQADGRRRRGTACRRGIVEWAAVKSGSGAVLCCSFSPRLLEGRAAANQDD